MSKNITVNGTTYDASYVNAPLADGSGNATFRESSELSLQSKSVTPTEDEQLVTKDSNYFGLSSVAVKAIPNTYVKPTSTNAGGELTAGSTIAAGTYFTGEATVPSGGGLAEGQVAVYWPYTNGKILWGETTLSSNTGNGGSIEFTLNGSFTGPANYILCSNQTGGTSLMVGGYGLINTNPDEKLATIEHSYRETWYPVSSGYGSITVGTAENGNTTLSISTGSNFAWKAGTYRILVVQANGGGII